MNNDIDLKDMADDFKDIEKEDKSKNYIGLVILLYIIVIVLIILLVFGLKNQKDNMINDSIQTQTNENNLNR